MKIRILAIGARMPVWVTQGIATFQKRLPREWQFNILELPLAPRYKNSSAEALMQIEGEQILARLSADELVIALDRQGKMFNTYQLATSLNEWQQYQQVSILIGGPEGLATSCLTRAQQCWSLSSLTLPHPLVRVLLTEQLYRAWSILMHHPYHR